MHLSSYTKMGDFVAKYIPTIVGLKVLDVGSLSTNGNYKNYFTHRECIYEGTDIVFGNNVDFLMEGDYKIPRDDDTYDVVISGQAMEHVEWFWEWIMELKRVLKPGGLLYIAAPGSGPLHDKRDCWRFHPDGMRALADWADLKLLETFMTQENEWWDCCLICKKP